MHRNHDPNTYNTRDSYKRMIEQLASSRSKSTKELEEKFTKLEAAFDRYEILTNVEYNPEDKLHRLINILPSEVYQQLSIIMPMENWKYQNLKSQIRDMINITYRFQAQETISHGKGPSLFTMEGNGEGNDHVDDNEMWGYDVNTYEPVNLIQHVQHGGVGFDDDWNVASEHTIDALVQKRRQGAKKGGKQAGKGGVSIDITCFRCGRKGHKQLDCRSTTVIGKGGPKGKGKPGQKGKSKGKGKGNEQGKGKGGPKGGCFTCGGDHFASNCPGKGSASSLDSNTPKTVPPPPGAPGHWTPPPGASGATHPQPKPFEGPPSAHPALAQCNTGMPQPGKCDAWFGQAFAFEAEFPILERPNKTNNIKIKIFSSL